MKKWKCPKCSILNAANITRCSWCSCPKPADVDAVQREATERVHNNLQTSIHDAVEKMSHAQRVMLWRWMEDNIL